MTPEDIRAAETAEQRGTTTPDARDWPLGARSSVRRGLLQLLAIALVPLLVLGVGRSAVELDRSRGAVEAQLSERALETARSEAEVIRTARVVLRLLADNDDIRAGGTLCGLSLAKLKAEFAAFSAFGRFRADGSLACASTTDSAGVTVAREAWWPTEGGRGRFFITGPQWGKLSKRQVLFAVQPIETPEGAFDGAVAASIDMAWMQRSLRSRELGEDAIALVLDDSGRTVMRSHAVELGPIDVNIGPGRVADITSKDGRRWTYAVAPLIGSHDGRRMLHVAYAMPRAQLFSAAWWQAGLGLAQPLVAVLLASLAIWFGTNRLVLRWLRELREMTLAFTSGDYHARAVDFTNAPSEFRDVAAAFIKMGQAVERRDTHLREALDRQNRLVKEIHHRVKNNLQIVMSLISLQAGRLDTESGRAALSQTRLRISALALVHRLLYETGEQTTMSAADLLGGVFELVSQSFRDRTAITVEAHFGEDELVLDTAIPLALWLVDAMSNAWLHAFPDNRPGHIAVSLVREGDEGVLEVADNGVGFVPDAAPSSPARGLRILNGIGRQVGGNTEVVSEPGEGTMLRLRYPAGKAARPMQ